MMKKALEGVRVVDLSRVLAGPFCTMILGDLGADVIKVESPHGGDETRAWGPPFQGDISAYYLCANRNKRSIAIDLKSQEGCEVIRRLAEHSDVLIENFRPGKAQQLGLGYEQMIELNPGLVYCSISGFGQTGPYRDLPGYDFVIQAMSGLMSITGDRDGPPTKVGVAVGDVFTGLFAAVGILSALRVKEQTGRGQHIDLALFDTQVAALVNVAGNYLVSGKVPQRHGNQHPNIVPYQTFPAADGEIAVAVGNDGQFRRLCDALALPDLAADPRFATNEKRVRHRAELLPLLEEAFRQKDGSVWMTELARREIPCGPINRLDQVFEDAHLSARELIQKVNHPFAGELALVGSPLKLSETPITVERHPPDLGEHTDEVLLDLGYDTATITRGRADGWLR